MFTGIFPCRLSITTYKIIFRNRTMILTLTCVLFYRLISDALRWSLRNAYEMVCLRRQSLPPRPMCSGVVKLFGSSLLDLGYSNRLHGKSHRASRFIMLCNWWPCLYICFDFVFRSLKVKDGLDRFVEMKRFCELRSMIYVNSDQFSRNFFNKFIQIFNTLEGGNWIP